MTISASIATADSLALAALVLAAVVTDLRSRRIPNRLVLAGLALAVASHAAALLTGAPSLAGPAWWAPLAGLLTAGLALMPLHLLRACGAGDVKLMAMAGAFLGAPAALRAVLFTLLVGGVLSVFYMLGRGVAAQAFANLRFMLTEWLLRVRGGGQGIALAPLASTAARLPYGVAISAGTLIVLLSPTGG
ncbi:A24 family peptidase [Ideonella sp.]|uniref:A24 family peptidase n=1 Tax=Ideonella sp. TaxID=1929293 RepID=UPI002B479319|nr:prepilin peptidase [Ideonella sp.]HJV69437.1 prepilin peptidase [Ideonella sp.]